MVTIEQTSLLLNEMATLLWKMSMIDSLDNLRFKIIDDVNSETSATYNLPRYMISAIVVNICNCKTEDDVVNEICHELAHSLLIEYTEFYDTWLAKSDKLDRNEPCFKCFVRAEEQTAMKLSRLIKEIWNKRSQDEKH